MRARALIVILGFLLVGDPGMAQVSGTVAADSTDVQTLAAEGAEIEEILDAWSAWRPDSAQWRARWTESGASLRITVEGNGCEVQGRRAANGTQRVAAAVSHGGWSVIVGGWRAVSATGWLSVGGERSRTLSASAPPVPVGAAAGPDLSTWRSRPVHGLLVRRLGTGWRLQAGAGEDGGAGRQASAPRWLALEVGGGALRTGISGLARDGERAGAWSGELVSRRGRVWWETALCSGVGRRSAFQGGAAWRPAHGWSLDAAWSVAAVGFRLLEGGRSPLIPGPAGRGWALRLRRTVAGSVQLAAVVHGGVAEAPERGPDELEERRLAEIRAEMAWNESTRLRLRARLREEERDGWEEREVWNPPAPSRRERDTTLAGAIDTRRGDTLWRLDFRGRRLEAAGLERRRFRLAVTREAPAPGGGCWSLRSAVAWGDALDLVTVAVPAPGVPVLRHWGSRADESSLGWRGPWGPGVWTAAAWWSSTGSSGSPEVGILLVFQGSTATSGRAAGF